MDDDKRIIKFIRDGHADAFEDLIVKYQKQAQFMAFRYMNNWDEADDITQTAFIKLYKHIIDSGKEIAVFPWLRKVIINLCLDSKKSRKWLLFFKNALRPNDSFNEKGKDSVPFDKIQDMRLSPEHSFLNKELKSHIDLLVDELPGQQRAVFYMKHFEGLKVKDIAQLLDVSEGQVKSQLFRAVRKLRKGLEDFYEG